MTASLFFFFVSLEDDRSHTIAFLCPHDNTPLFFFSLWAESIRERKGFEPLYSACCAFSNSSPVSKRSVPTRVQSPEPVGKV